MAHLAVIRLRMTKPDFPRPYKGPGNVKWRGVDWPLFAVAGGFFTAVAFVVIVVLNPTVAVFGVALAGARDGRLPRSSAASRGWT